MICGFVPNIGIDTKEHQRHGVKCNVRKIPNSAPARLQTISSASLTARGCKLFHFLPKHIRNLKNITVEKFKGKFDIFLNTVPDQPCLSGYYQRAENNRLIAQTTVLHDAIRKTPHQIGGEPLSPIPA